MIINLGITSKPCWLDVKLESATMTNCRVEDEHVYFDIDGRSLRFRVPLEDPGMPGHVYAPNGFKVPTDGIVLIGECTQWGYEIYWLVLDVDWFNSLPIKHDGLAHRSCPDCKEKGF